MIRQGKARTCLFSTRIHSKQNLGSFDLWLVRTRLAKILNDELKQAQVVSRTYRMLATELQLRLPSLPGNERPVYDHIEVLCCFREKCRPLFAG